MPHAGRERGASPRRAHRRDRHPGAAGAARGIDLDGWTLLPGFIDAHAHPVFAAGQLRRCDLSAGRGLPDYLEIVAGCVRDQAA